MVLCVRNSSDEGFPRMTSSHETLAQDEQKFEKMIGGLQPIESDLHRHLIEHLNAEVVLQTITNLEVAMRWLSSTFLHIRARKNPRYYGLTSSDPSTIDRRLLEMCQIELNKLIKVGMLTIDQDVSLKATPVGAAMAKYYLAFETMRLFTLITGGEILQQILALISRCHEFSEMFLRVNDKKCLNLLNKCRDKQTIRFPLNGKIKTVDMKINCIIQAVLGCLDICDHSILSETLKIMRNGERIVNCLIEYLESKDTCFRALLSTIILAKCFVVKLWENSPFVSKQLPGIGNVMSSQLAKAGKTTFQLISQCDAREIELIIGKKPPTGNIILKHIRHLPQYFLKLERVGKSIIKVIISLKNAEDLGQTCTVNRNSLMYLLVGDADNNVLLYEKYSHMYLVENPVVVRFIDFQENNLEDIEAHFISEDWVGIDCVAKFETTPKVVVKETEKGKKSGKKNQNDQLYMQTFMEMYMSNKKNKDVKKKNEGREDEKDGYEQINNSKIIIHGNVTIFDDKNNYVIERDAKPIETNRRASKSDDAVPETSSSSTQRLGSAFESTSKEVMSKPDDTLPRRSLSSVFSPTISEKLRSSDTELDQDSDIKKRFIYTPKKLSHSKGPSVTSQTCTDLNKNVSSEHKPKSQKITWRSPLTYSPLEKFSPKFPYNRLNMSSAESDCLAVSHASSSSSTSKNQDNLNRTLNSTPSLSKTFFPLSDKEYEESFIEEKEAKLARRQEVLEKVGDFAATQFLESCGLISPLEKTNKSPPKSQIKSPNEYYHHLLTQSQTSKECDKNEKKRKRDAKCESLDNFYTPELGETSFGQLQNPGKKSLMDNIKECPTQSPYFADLDGTRSGFPVSLNRSQSGTSQNVNFEKLTQTPKTPVHIYRKHSSVRSDRKTSFSEYSDLLSGEETKDVLAFNNRTSSSQFGSNRFVGRGRSSEDDPLNDSKEAAFRELIIPSQIVQGEKSLNRRDSDYFHDFEDETFMLDIDEAEIYNNSPLTDNHSRKSLSRRNSNQFGDNDEDIFANVTSQVQVNSASKILSSNNYCEDLAEQAFGADLESISTIDEEPCDDNLRQILMQNKNKHCLVRRNGNSGKMPEELFDRVVRPIDEPIKPSDRHTSVFFPPIDRSMNRMPQSRYENYDYHAYQKPTGVVYNPYQTYKRERFSGPFNFNSNPVEWYSEPPISYGRERFDQANITHTPRDMESSFSSRHPNFNYYHEKDVCEEGYRYLRHIMDRENNPPYPGDRSFSSYNHYQRRRGAPECTTVSNQSGLSQENLFDGDRYDFERANRRPFRTPLRQRRDLYPQYYPMAVERSERRRYSQASAPSYPDDKDYVMQRFLSQTDSKNGPSQFYN